MTKITETALRDAHQSLFATRMRTEDIVKAAPILDKVGYASLEAWGGATFDACLRFLAEDPWERLRAVKKAAPNTPIQMLLRGQNLVGYRNYADDVVDFSIKCPVCNRYDAYKPGGDPFPCTPLAIFSAPTWIGGRCLRRCHVSAADILSAGQSK